MITWKFPVLKIIRSIRIRGKRRNKDIVILWQILLSFRVQRGNGLYIGNYILLEYMVCKGIIRNEVSESKIWKRWAVFNVKLNLYILSRKKCRTVRVFQIYSYQLALKSLSYSCYEHQNSSMAKMTWFQVGPNM